MWIASIIIGLMLAFPAFILNGADEDSDCWWNKTDDLDEEEKRNDKFETITSVLFTIGIGFIIFFVANIFVFFPEGGMHKTSSLQEEQIIELKAFQDEELNDVNYTGSFFLVSGFASSNSNSKYVIHYITEVDDGLFQRKTIETDNDDDTVFYNFTDGEVSTLTIVYEYDVYEQNAYEKIMFPTNEMDENGKCYGEKKIIKYIFNIPEGSIKYDNSIND